MSMGMDASKVLEAPPPRRPSHLDSHPHLCLSFFSPQLNLFAPLFKGTSVRVLT